MKRMHVHVVVDDVEPGEIHTRLAWESFHSQGAVPVFGEDTAVRSAAQKTACCAPAGS